jgi:hypothetical protein
MKWAGHLMHTGGLRNAYKIFVGNVEERVLEKPRL